MFYEETFRALNKARVKYLVAGGLAVNLHGIPRMTQDLDILVDLSPPNIRNLVAALTSTGYCPKLPVDPMSLSNPSARQTWITEKNMRAFSFFNNNVPIAEVEVLLISPVKFADAAKRAVHKKANDIVIPLASIPDLIKMKKNVGRPIDISDIQMLKMIEKERKRNA